MTGKINFSFLKKMGKTWLSWPYLIFGIMFVILPFLFIIINAFDDSFVSNFNEFFKTSNDGQISTFVVLLKSLGYALIVTFIAVLLSYPYAVFLTKLKNRRLCFAALIFIVVPLYMNSIIRLIGMRTVVDFIFEDDTNEGRNIIAMVYSFLPLMIIPVYNNLAILPTSITDASKDLGNSSWKTFLKVTLPNTLPGLFSGIALVFLSAVTSVSIPLFMTPRVNWIGNIMYNVYDPSQLHTLSITSFGALVTLVVGVFTLSTYFFLKLIPYFFGIRQISRKRKNKNEF